MAKTNKHIEIVRTNIPGLSSMSLVSCNALYRALKQHYTSVGVSLVRSVTDLQQVVAKQPDLVFLSIKRLLDGEQTVWVSQYLEQHGVAHTGSPRIAIEFELNKPSAKQQIQSAGLKTAPYIVIEHGQSVGEVSHLSFPLFVKPSNLGGGQGIDEYSIVHTIDELRTTVARIMDMLHADVLIEQYLPGREFSVALLGEQVMPVELIAPRNAIGERILSQEVKTADKETALFVADPVLHKTLSDFAQAAFAVLGARDYGRIDIRLDAHGTPHFLEANLIPSLIKGYGSFPKACELNLGMSHQAMAVEIVELALARTLSDEVEDLPILLTPALA